MRKNEGKGEVSPPHLAPGQKKGARGGKKGFQRKKKKICENEAMPRERWGGGKEKSRSTMDRRTGVGSSKEGEGWHASEKI